MRYYLDGGFDLGMHLQLLIDVLKHYEFSQVAELKLCKAPGGSLK